MAVDPTESTDKQLPTHETRQESGVEDQQAASTGGMPAQDEDLQGDTVPESSTESTMKSENSKSGTMAKGYTNEGGFFPVVDDDENKEEEPAPKLYYHYFRGDPEKGGPKAAATPAVAEPVTAAEAWALAAELYAKGQTEEAQEAESLAAAMEAVEAAEGDQEDTPLLSADGHLASIKPMWYTTFLIDHTSEMLIGLSLLVVVLSVLGFMWPAKIDIDLQGFRITRHRVARQYDMMQAAVQTRELYLEHKRSIVTIGKAGEDQNARRKLLGDQAFQTVDPPTRRSVQWRIHLTYVASGTNILEHDILEHIRDLEHKIQNAPGYNDFCLVEPNGKSCAAPVSAVGYYFPSFDGAGQPVLDGKGDLVDLPASSDALVKMGMYWYTGNDFGPQHKRTKYLRSDFLFAGPLEGYANVFEDADEQRAKFNEFAASLVPVLKAASSEHVKVLFGGDGVDEEEVSNALAHDARMTLYLLGVFMPGLWWHTESLFLTLSALLQLLVSLPFAYFFYRSVFFVPYMTLLNFLAAFVVMCVGITNFVVFYDVFRACHSIEDLDIRLAYTMRKAGHTTFLTTVTMTVAFAAICFNEIPVIRVFGLLMSILVLANFMLIMVISPTVLILHYRYVQYWLGAREFGLWSAAGFKGKMSDFRRRPSDAQRDPNKNGGDEGAFVNGRQEDVGGVHGDVLGGEPKKADHAPRPNAESQTVTDNPLNSDTPEVPNKVESSAGASEDLDEPHRGVLFLRDTWSTWVIRFKIPIFVIFTIIVVISAVGVSFTKTASSLPQLFPEDDNYHQFHTSWMEKFTTDDNCDACGGMNQPGGGFVPDLGNGPISVRFILFFGGTTVNRWGDTSLQEAFTAALQTTSKSVGKPTQVAYEPPTNTKEATNPDLTGINLDVSISMQGAASAKTAVLDMQTKIQNGRFTQNLQVELRKRPTIDSRLQEKVVIKLLNGPAVVLGSMKSNGPQVPLPPAKGEGNDGTDPMRDTKVFLDSLPDQLPPNDKSSLDVNFVWGVAGLNKDANKGAWEDPFQTYWGTPKYDLRLKGGTTEEQSALLSACDVIKKSPLTKRIKRCVVADFVDYMKGLRNHTFPSGREASFPMPPEDFVEEFQTWTTGTSKDVGFSADGKKLMWVRAIFRSEVPHTMPSFERYKHYKQWDALLGELNQNTSKHLPPAFETSQGWVDMMTEIACVNGAKKSSVLATFFVFICVSNLSGSMAVAGYAFGAVTTTVVATLGIFASADWKLGAVEAITISVLVGLSCTFIVHFCDAYISCGLTWHKPELKDQAQRSVRVRAALAQVGVPLIVSAVLILLGSIVLCFTTIQIFSKVAQVVMANTIVASLHTFIFLPAVLASIGPELMLFSWGIEWIGLRACFGVIALGMAIVIAFTLSLEDP